MKLFVRTKGNKPKYTEGKEGLLNLTKTIKCLRGFIDMGRFPLRPFVGLGFESWQGRIIIIFVIDEKHYGTL